MKTKTRKKTYSQRWTRKEFFKLLGIPETATVESIGLITDREGDGVDDFLIEVQTDEREVG